MRLRIVCVCLFITWSNLFFCQISAEAQGGRMAVWLAAGFDQELSPRWTSVTDFGYGRHSDPDNNAVFKRMGLNVITQDFIFSVTKRLRLAFSAGYWKRNFYAEDAPFDARTKPYTFRNEVRPYQKLVYENTIAAIKITHTLRTDFRFYYSQDFHEEWTTPFEFRLRFMEKWKIPITPDRQNWIIACDELLSAVDLLKNNAFSTYQLTENRLSLYYRRSLIRGKIDVDLGIMHQYWRDRPGLTTFNNSINLMADVIIRNPFSG